MRHLIACREYPPAPYPASGIGMYARDISELLAGARHVVHVVAQRWEGPRDKIVKSVGSRLIIHRILLDEPIDCAAAAGLEEARPAPGASANN